LVGKVAVLSADASSLGKDKISTFIQNANNNSKWSTKYLKDNSDILQYNDGSNVLKNDFDDIVNAVYTEMGSVKKSTQGEARAIYSTIENRAKERNTNELEELKKKGSDGLYQIRGWSKKDRVDNLTNFAKPKLQKARQGVIMAMMNEKDYSNGAYFWHGKDLSQNGSLANSEYYGNGLNFLSSSYNLWKLTNNPQNKTKNKITWNYKYDSVNLEGQSTFMRLNNKWKKANKHAGNL
jgi:vacuolar-type H+-ATPase subunit H